jgi:hypothetical protein
MGRARVRTFAGGFFAVGRRGVARIGSAGVAVVTVGFFAVEVFAVEVLVVEVLGVEVLASADDFLAVEGLAAADGFFAVGALAAADGFLAVGVLAGADALAVVGLLAVVVRSAALALALVAAGLRGAVAVFGWSAAVSVGAAAAGPRFSLRRWGRVEGSDPITPRRSSLMGVMIAALVRGSRFLDWARPRRQPLGADRGRMTTEGRSKSADAADVRWQPLWAPYAVKRPPRRFPQCPAIPVESASTNCGDPWRTLKPDPRFSV